MKRPSAPESQMDLEFDIIGADPSLANAIRRILISEVPSMAIEKVSKILVQLSIPSSVIGLVDLHAIEIYISDTILFYSGFHVQQYLDHSR